MVQFVALATLLLHSHQSLAVEVLVDCARPNIFCMNEFEEIAEQSNSIEKAVELLPVHIRRNVTFKRGNNMDKLTVGALGPHGHMAGPASGSASPEQPRVFVWDELTGFTASWNSGNSAHSAHDRVDLYDFDFEKKEHRLFAWFPRDGKRLTGPDFVDSRNLSCMNCHGVVQRPIFPMYPDWPQFYGEFNDEMSGYPNGARALRSDLRTMANDFQPKEWALFRGFLQGEATANPRYTPIFAARPASSSANRYYPYRPRTTTSPFSDVSRAFYHRPNLRLGVLYNRLTALQTFEKIKKSPIFKKFPDVIFYSLMDCNWDFVEGQGQLGRQQILGKVLEEANRHPQLADINLRGAKFKPDEVPTAERSRYFAADEGGQTIYYKHRAYTEPNYQQLPYEDLLKLLDLNIADMDIRFRHDSSLKVAKGYNVYDPRAFYNTHTAMDIGYIERRYPMNPVCDNNNRACSFNYDDSYMAGMRYFNSYFDGAATTNELLVAQMLLFLTDLNQDFSNEPDLQQVRDLLRAKVSNPTIYFETLMQKYARFTDRLELDRAFFQKMDAIGPWIQLPFPPDMLNIQNREAFWGDGRTANIRARHAQWLTRQDRTRNRKNLNGGQNLCWNIYDSMHARYRR